ncbi:MAG: MltA domain-containing protein [Rickettsiales bacterium]|jgi:membrane-bound lytic murein transglycosylase A|nr:MltA domain-containing protein [Rickettsiales bacterium]
MKKLIFVLLLSSCGIFDMPDHAGDQSKITRNMTPVGFSELPGWRNDDQRYALQAFRNTCRAKSIQYAGRVVPDEQLVREKCRFLPGSSADTLTVRKWFEQHFKPYKVSDDATKGGKFTGYATLIIPACRQKSTECSAPVLGVPKDGREFKGVHSQRIINDRIGEILYWTDPIDLQVAQINGAAKLALDDGTEIRLSVATTNEMQFTGIGAQLVERGIRPPDGYGMHSVREYLKKNRALAAELISNNARYVYYAESAADEVTGNMGVPLTKIRSVAIDKNIYTLGMPTYVATTLTNGKSFQKLMVAQDTGSAIIGYNRGDIYFGEGDEAFEYAQGQNAPGQMYILLPKEYR